MPLTGSSYFADAVVMILVRWSTLIRISLSTNDTPNLCQLTPYLQFSLVTMKKWKEASPNYCPAMR